jgi:phosphoribosylformylglycinamidine synthase
MTRALLLRTAGTNCDRETALALALAGAEVEVVHVRRAFEAPAMLERTELVVLPGGFSYGDDIAAGRVLGHELRTFLGDALARFVERGGFVLGVCNGFQALVESGLLEGLGARPSERSIALTDNASGRFECRWVTLREERCAAAWLEPGALLPVPVAHGEGRLVARDGALLARLERSGQVALRYAHEDGRIASEYPACPNGSSASIAGLCDATGRVLGLMPHPERNVQPWHHPRWTRGDARSERDEAGGLRFYRRLVRAASAAR